ncbi:MAG: gas vesicle protein [Ignavibacteria bacterium]|jgi:nucleotide-binding universal stress UspA family protein|nr:gas vesicle protein [Ignavibacteria bacterium]
MERSPQTMVHAVEASTLADILERVLDKGVVIAGDIKIKLVDVELLTIQIRLVIASVERAKEMGIDWWESSPFLSSKAKGNGEQKELIDALKQRIEKLENNVIRSPEEVE